MGTSYVTYADACIAWGREDGWPIPLPPRWLPPGKASDGVVADLSLRLVRFQNFHRCPICHRRLVAAGTGVIWIELGHDNLRRAMAISPYAEVIHNCTARRHWACPIDRITAPGSITRGSVGPSCPECSVPMMAL